MIDYVYKDIQNRIVVVSGSTVEVLDEPLSTVIERWMNESLSTYAGRRKAIAKRFGIRRNQPIVRNATEIFVPLSGIRGDGTVLINVVAVAHVEEGRNRTTFVFRSGIVFEAKNPPSWKNRFETARALEAYWQDVR